MIHKLIFKGGWSSIAFLSHSQMVLTFPWWWVNFKFQYLAMYLYSKCGTTDFHERTFNWWRTGGSLPDSLTFSIFLRTTVINQRWFFEDFENGWISGYNTQVNIWQVSVPNSKNCKTLVQTRYIYLHVEIWLKFGKGN